jgi:hypothetical protein
MLNRPLEQRRRWQGLGVVILFVVLLGVPQEPGVGAQDVAAAEARALFVSVI